MRKMGPISDGHPAVKNGEICLKCDGIIKVGDFVTLIPVRAADAEEELRKAQGKIYLAQAAIIHWDCLPPDPPAVPGVEANDRAR
jgi:hypothetical protein